MKFKATKFKELRFAATKGGHAYVGNLDLLSIFRKVPVTVWKIINVTPNSVAFSSGFKFIIAKPTNSNV
jgi:hypothetical protein